MLDYTLLFLVVGGLLALVAPVIRNNPRGRQNRLFASLLAWTSVWILFNFFEYEVNLNLAKILIRFDFASASIVAYYFLQFSLNFPAITTTRRQNYALGAIAILFAGLSCSNLFVKEGKQNPSGDLPFEAGPLYFLYAVFIILYFGHGTVRLFLKRRRAHGIRKAQITYILLGIGIAAFVAGTINLILSQLFKLPVSVYRLGIYSVSSLGVFTTYAIVWYRLMDVGLIARRSLAYGVLVGSLAALFTLVIMITEKLNKIFLGGIPGVPTLVAIGILVAIYEPLRKKINIFVDKFIFHSPDLKVIIQQFNEIIRNNQDFASLTSSLVVKLKENWPIEHAGVVLWDADAAQYRPLPEDAFRDKLVSQIKHYRIDERNFLVKNLKYEKRLFFNGVVLADEAKALANRSCPGERVTFLKVRRTMRLLGADLCAPVMVGDSLAGFLVLGSKRNRMIFTLEDRKIIAEIARIVGDTVKNLIQVTNGKNEKAVHLIGAPYPSII